MPIAAGLSSLALTAPIHTNAVAISPAIKSRRITKDLDMLPSSVQNLMQSVMYHTPQSSSTHFRKPSGPLCYTFSENGQGSEMKLRWRQLILSVAAAAKLASAQQPAPDAKPRLAEEVFKNIQVLKGIPVSQFMETMGFFSASLGVNCTYCHVQEAGGNWAKYADDNGNKQMARRMILMVTAMNKANFGGRRALTCY